MRGMQSAPYIYFSPKSQLDSMRAIIVLPEIYGLNKFVRSVADRAATDLSALGFGLDHFYSIRQTTEIIGYDEHAKGVELMAQVKSEEYINLLKITEMNNMNVDKYKVVDIGLIVSSFIVDIVYNSEYKITSQDNNHTISFCISNHGGADNNKKNINMKKYEIEEKYYTRVVEKIYSSNIKEMRKNAEAFNKNKPNNENEEIDKCKLNLFFFL